MQRRGCALLLAMAAPGLALAMDKAPPDPDLLEFLGSVDSDAGDWSKYLESTDLDKLAGAGKPAKPAEPVKPGGPARPGTPPAQDRPPQDAGKGK